jgi:catalase
MGWLTAARQVRAPVTFALAFPPRRYGRLSYYTVNTFVWSKAGAEPQPVRYRWWPVKGRLRLLPWTRLFKNRHYLERELMSSVNRDGIRFRLEVQCPASREATPAQLADPAKPLRRIEWTPVGTLHLDRIVTGAEAAELDLLVFNPTHLVEGVETYPGDEIMAARAAAYPASHVARAGDPR